MGKKKESLFIFSPEEVERYKVHGIAHARINQMIPVPLSKCYISLKELVEVDIPKYVWIKCEPEAPHIIISSGRQNHIPKSAIPIKFNRNLESLELRIWHNSDNYGPIELTPVYNK